jgi:hypothetical protein
LDGGRSGSGLKKQKIGRPQQAAARHSLENQKIYLSMAT